MAEVTVIGKLLDGSEERDAIHVAVAPMIAGERLYPGQHIGLQDGSRDKATTAAKLIGIVDPFLAHPVLPGERCWMFLYPYTITSLRHRWEHPDFPANAQSVEQPGYNKGNGSLHSASEKWLREFAEQCDIGYSDMMSGAKDWIECGEYLCRGGLLEGVRVPDEFWEHYEKVVGTTVDEDKKENFFTCSC